MKKLTIEANMQLKGCVTVKVDDETAEELAQMLRCEEHERFDEAVQYYVEDNMDQLYIDDLEIEDATIK